MACAKCMPIPVNVVSLRQRLSRLVRKTLLFSKREDTLNLHFKLFAYFHNLEHLSACYSRYRKFSLR